MAYQDLSDREIFAHTVYAEARDQPQEGQEWVAWVIKNRVKIMQGRGQSKTIKQICLNPAQFECWNDGVRQTWYPPRERAVYESIHQLTNQIYDQPSSADPTHLRGHDEGADHYNNPAKETAMWVPNCDVIKRIKDHVFYLTKPEHRPYRNF